MDARDRAGCLCCANGRPKLNMVRCECVGGATKSHGRGYVRPVKPFSKSLGAGRVREWKV